MSTTRSRFAPPPVPPAALAAIRRRLSALRAAAKFSPEALSAKAGLSPSAVRKIETGQSAPALGTLYALARALGCAPADLIADGPKNNSGKS
jgi:transcriptional regulator with XRE-family HTH domain